MVIKFMVTECFGIEVVEIEIVEINDGAAEAIIKVGLAGVHEIDGVVAWNTRTDSHRKSASANRAKPRKAAGSTPGL